MLKKWIRAGAMLGLAGFLLSGPVAVLIVTLTFPQPAWESVTLFIQHYHPVQILPYYLGLLILAGMSVLTTGHLLQDIQQQKQLRPQMMLSIGLAIAFVALITFNYLCQISFIPNMVKSYRPEYESLIAGFSMANPESYCWANEMWGYALLGLSTWAGAILYKTKSKRIHWLMIGNGLISLISPVWTIVDPSWVMTTTGMGLFLFWNIWMIVLMLAILVHWRKQVSLSPG